MLLRFVVLVASLTLGASLPRGAQAQTSLSDPDLTRRREARMERELARGRAQAAAGHTALAQRHFEDAMRANPSAPQPYLELGRTFLALGRPTDAIAALEAGRLRAPDDAELVAALAEALVASAREQDALRLLREATRRHRAHVDLQRRRGELAQAVGAWSEAADAYAAVLDLAEGGVPVPPELVEHAAATLRALGIVLGDAHPRAHRCDGADTTSVERWSRALAACGPAGS